MASPMRAVILGSRALRCLRAAALQTNYTAVCCRREISFKLDEKTAHSSLDLSKKDTAVIYRILGIDPSKVLQTPERFREWAVVLGDTPIVSGRHYWEVTVKKSNEFRIGVADADMSRDECIGVSNQSWVFAYSHKKWNGMVVKKIIPITNIGHPSKVGILLDYEGRKLSLVDSEKGSLIHTLKADFRGPVLPAFALWDGELLTHSGLDVPAHL
ncbi:SPRY domain-containing protein 4 [Eleutherodactylus coqui]|uniref:SPRY domain-containing protein 4 n=1 Tax=Eleutherodactylus coqui TaxID=57060 RepID=UPI0034621AF8